jgi:hypothetical protein
MSAGMASVVGGLLCVGLVILVATLVPALLRYDARHPPDVATLDVD